MTVLQRKEVSPIAHLTPDDIEAIGRELDARMLALGAEAPSFETIVASGPNGAKPHARPGTRRVQRGDLVEVAAILWVARAAVPHRD